MAKCAGQSGGALDDLAARMCQGQADNSLLQINHHQCGGGIKLSERHGTPFD